MNRRTFLKRSATLSALAAVPQLVGRIAPISAQPREFSPRPGTWRSFEIVTRVEIAQPSGVTRVWLPVPSVTTEYQRAGETTWSGNAVEMRAIADPKYGARMVYAEFAPGEPAPAVLVVSRVQTQDCAIDWSRRMPVAADAAGLATWTTSTELMPIDGIVRETALEITRGKTTDLEKAKAVFDWILVTTYREPKVRGCGVGGIRAMLETRAYGGKCADLNGLVVGLLRSVGVPARDVYGIRVAPSAFGYKSLGAGSATISKAQHCRAEVFLRDYGWVAMDPADVAKAAREETSERLKIDHPLVAAVRPKLFGGWEGNWVAFNMAHDVALPNATRIGKVGFLMYPHAETAEGQRDGLDPESFKYVITAREIPS